MTMPDFCAHNASMLRRIPQPNADTDKLGSTTQLMRWHFNRDVCRNTTVFPRWQRVVWLNPLMGMAGLEGAYQRYSVHHQVWQKFGVYLPLRTDITVATNLCKHVVLALPMP